MVIDSHTLLWWLERAPSLSPTAYELLDGAGQGDDSFFVCGVTFWELYRKELHGGLKPRMSVREWPSLLERLGWLQVTETTTLVWLKMAELDWEHRDPADRLIAATALQHGVPVLTKDRAFHAEDSPVDAVW